MRLSDAQSYGVRCGDPRVWLGTLETGVQGSTMQALERKRLAVVRSVKRPYVRLVYRLTTLGNELRVEWAIDEASRPPAHTPIRVRCTHCSAEFPDGTPGGSCGACGLTVEAIEEETT